MPLYNDKRHVAEALNSLVSGATAPAEIIVVDNASTDGSVAAIEALEIPVRIICNVENVGATRARHQAVGDASQPFIFFIDSDDWISPDALEAAHAASEKNDSDIALLRLLRVSGNGGETLFTLEGPVEPITGIDALKLTLGSWRIHTIGLYRRDLYHRASAKFDFHGFSDDEFLSRTILAEARNVVGCDGTYFYRQNPKAYNFAKIVGQTTTNLRSTALAAERFGADFEGTRAMRDVVVRNLLGLRWRTLRGEGTRGDVARLASELRALAIPFGAANSQAALQSLALRLLA